MERRERGKRSQFFAARFFSFLFLSLLLLALEDPEGLERRRSTGRGEGERGRSGQSEWQLEEERGEGRRFFFLFDFGACSPLARRAGASPAPPSALFPSPSAKVLEAGAREGRGRSPGVRKVGLTGARSFQAGFFFFLRAPSRLTTKASRPSLSRLARSHASIPSSFDQKKRILSLLGVEAGAGSELEARGREAVHRAVFFFGGGGRRHSSGRETDFFSSLLSLSVLITSLVFYFRSFRISLCSSTTKVSLFFFLACPAIIIKRT